MSRIVFPTVRTTGDQVFPAPADGACVLENPPALVWLPVRDENGHRPEVTASVWNADGALVYTGKTRENTAVPTEILPVGDYTWDLSVTEDGETVTRGIQHFTVTEDSVPVLRPTVDQILAGLPASRPRHLFCPEDREALIAANAPAVEVLRRNIAQAYRDGLPEMPRYHYDPDALPYREYFGRFRDFCDRDLVACSLGYALLGDEEAGAYAKRLFLHICSWNPADSGPCSLMGRWGDEVGLSCARCFPAVFDMLYPLLDEKQRFYAIETVAAYAKQCEWRLNRIDYAANPGDNHAGRLPAYLGEAALTLWGTGYDETVLRRWLEKSMTIYCGMFPFFGGEDGGWAQGTFYSTSYTKWYLPFFSMVERFAGEKYSFLRRPFYRNYARFLLHFALPDHENHPFCDGYWCNPDSPEWPGFFAQNPFRVYASLSGPDEALEYDRKLSAPELYSLHLLDVFLPIALPHKTDYPAEPVTDADMFPDTGFVSLHSDRTEPEHDLHLIAHATKFGPGSHRQPDQGSFALYYGGTALISPSGYFGRAYGTKHHMQWMNTTKANNAILVDGVGQDFHNFTHTGKILSCGMENGVRKTVLDLSASYPMLTHWYRTFSMTDDRTVIVEDDILAPEPVTVTYPLHTLSAPEKVGETVSVKRNNIRMTINPDAGCFSSCTLSDKFDVDLNEGEPEQFHVTMPKQFHIYYETEKRAEHKLTVTFRVDA
ncbi:MAG: heparinase II/III-family protein [Clostridia bacterium]|nr:heparinase II/III-family protein [Clostridia bacterium]